MRVFIFQIFRLRREIFRVHTCARSPATASVAQWIERCFPKARVVGSIPIRGIFCFLPPCSPTRRPRGGDVDAPDAPVAARELAGIEETRRVFAAWAPALFSFPFFFLFRLFFGRARDERLARFSRPFVSRSDHRSCRVVFTLKRREQRVRKRARRRLWRRLFTAGAMTKGSFWSTSVTRLIFYTRARARRRPRRVVALRLAKILRSRGPILTPRP